MVSMPTFILASWIGWLVPEQLILTIATTVTSAAGTTYGDKKPLFILILKSKKVDVKFKVVEIFSAFPVFQLKM